MKGWLRVKQKHKKLRDKIMGDFEKLKVWNRAKDLAVFVYKVTCHGELAKDYGLRDQIRARVKIYLTHNRNNSYTPVFEIFV